MVEDHAATISTIDETIYNLEQWKKGRNNRSPRLDESSIQESDIQQFKDELPESIEEPNMVFAPLDEPKQFTYKHEDLKTVS